MLTVVGTVALDTLARVKRLPEREQTGGILDLHPDLPGGTAGNVTSGLAKLGERARLLSAVGPDFAPHAPRLEELGVDASALIRSQTPTSRAYVFFDDQGQQVTYFYPGACREIHEAPAPTGRAHFCAGEMACYPRLMAEAEWVSFDPGQEVFHRDLKDVLACMEHVDVLFLNHLEREALEQHGEWKLKAFLDAGATAVVETRGAEGTLVHTRTGRYAAAAVPVKVREPTGAGDAHRAGFLYALGRGADMGAAARFANVVASFVIEQVGAQAGQPSLQQALARHEQAFGERPFG